MALLKHRWLGDMNVGTNDEIRTIVNEIGGIRVLWEGNAHKNLTLHNVSNSGVLVIVVQFDDHYRGEAAKHSIIVPMHGIHGHMIQHLNRGGENADRDYDYLANCYYNGSTLEFRSARNWRDFKYRKVIKIG